MFWGLIGLFILYYCGDIRVHLPLDLATFLLEQNNQPIVVMVWRCSLPCKHWQLLFQNKSWCSSSDMHSSSDMSVIISNKKLYNASSDTMVIGKNRVYFFSHAKIHSRVYILCVCELLSIQIYSRLYLHILNVKQFICVRKSANDNGIILSCQGLQIRLLYSDPWPHSLVFSDWICHEIKIVYTAWPTERYKSMTIRWGSGWGVSISDFND